MIGQKNMGVKHFFRREMEGQVQKNLDLDPVFMVTNGRSSGLTYWQPTDPVVTAVTTGRNLFSQPCFLAFTEQVIANVLGHNTVQRSSSARGFWPVRVRSV